jgi:hypothetical protein
VLLWLRKAEALQNDGEYFYFTPTLATGKRGKDGAPESLLLR